MAWGSFREFVEALDRAGELIRIQEPVATELEITAWADQQMKAPGGGKALYFEQPTVNGQISPFPVAINTMGSWRRMTLALGVEDLEELVESLRGLLRARPPMSWRQAWELFQTALDLRHARPRRVKTGPCKEVIHRFDPVPIRTEPWPPAPRWPEDPEALAQAVADPPQGPFPTVLDLPVLKCWPLDAGRFFTLPCVVTVDPETGERNVGMYRMQVYEPLLTGMHWQLQKTGAQHFRRYQERKRRMPVAVFLGGDPVYTFAATAPLPEGVDELVFAGYLRRQAVELVLCETCPLEVPADAEIVIEGYVEPQEPLREEGPFGDHTGFYTAPEPYPVFHITAVTHRKEAIYPATIVGVPPKEDFYLGSAAVRLFLPVLQLTFPEIVDLALPAEGVFHNFVFVSIRKRYPLQAYKIMHGLWGMGQMMFSKYIVVVDEDVNVHDTREVLFQIGANTDPQRDCLISRGPADVLDHATSNLGIGGKLGIDATRKLPGEGIHRPWPPPIRISPRVQRLVEQKVKELLEEGGEPRRT